jgi:hypothetical protein
MKMFIKLIFSILFQIGLFYEFTNGQSLPISTQTTFNFSSSKYIRILDGYLLPDTIKNPSNLNINRIITLEDAENIKRYNLPASKKPYMILSTEVSDLRNYIYELANVNSVFRGINLPIVLNNQLITFEKYQMFELIDKKKISQAKLVKEKKMYNGMRTPFGIVKITTK